MSSILLDRLAVLQREQRNLKRRIERLEQGTEIRYTYLDDDHVKRERDLRQVRMINYTLDLARSGLILVERILKEMRGIIENKIEYNNPIYTTQLDILKGELSCIEKLFVYDKTEIFNPDGWEWDIGCSNYKWNWDLAGHVARINYTNNGPTRIDTITANIARSYIDIDSILLNVNINNSAILDVQEGNRREVVDQILYDRLRLITTEINDVINCILQKV